jgi:hypothetical protein
MPRGQVKNKPVPQRNRRAVGNSPPNSEKKETFKPSPALTTKSIVIIICLVVVVGLVAWVLFSGKKKTGGNSVNVGGQADIFQKSGTPNKLTSPSPCRPMGSPSLLEKLQSLTVE